MSYTLHTTTAAATGLIAQPGRAVNTFPSGLVRVDQTYIGRTALASTHRAILAVGNNMPAGDTSPCIDGLKIFPEAQERRREDGFTEYIVSAYGRSNATGKKTLELELGEITSIIAIQLQGNIFKTEKCTKERLIWEFSAQKNAQCSIEPVGVPKVFYYDGTIAQQKSLVDLLLPNQKIGYFNEPGNQFQDPQNITAQIGKKFEVNNIEKRNFGLFDEWVITYVQPDPTFDFSFGALFIANGIQDSTWDDLIHKGLYKQEPVLRVYNIDANTQWIGNPDQDTHYVELTSAYQPTQTGEAKIQLQGNTYSIVNHFGYYTPTVDNLGVVFTPFSRPLDGMWMSSQQPMPPIIFQGVAEWRPSIGPVDQGNGGNGARHYVYNLYDPIYARYDWTVTNEFNQASYFNHEFEYNPEELVP